MFPKTANDSAAPRPDITRQYYQESASAAFFVTIHPESARCRGPTWQQNALYQWACGDTLSKGSATHSRWLDILAFSHARQCLSRHALPRLWVRDTAPQLHNPQLHRAQLELLRLRELLPHITLGLKTSGTNQSHQWHPQYGLRYKHPSKTSQTMVLKYIYSGAKAFWNHVYTSVPIHRQAIKFTLGLYLHFALPRKTLPLLRKTPLILHIQHQHSSPL